MILTNVKPRKYGQWIAGLAVCGCSLTTGQGFTWPAAAIPKIYSRDAEIPITDDEISWLVSLIYLGNVISPIPTGYIMDKYGRRNTLMCSLLLSIASWLLIYFSYSAIALYTARILSGLFAGVVYTAAPVLIGELVDPVTRSKLGAIFAVAMFVGAFYESIAGLASYRILAILSALPSVLLFIVFLFLPESPYYHLRHGNKEKAKESYIWLTGECPEDKLAKIQISVREQLKSEGSFYDLIKTKANRKAFIIVQTLCILQRGSGIALIFGFITIVVPDSFVSAEQSFVLLCAVWITCSVISSLFMDKFGRRIILFISFMGNGLSLLSLTVWLYLRDNSFHESTYPEWPLISLIIAGIFYSTGVASIPQMVQGEMFSVSVKAKGSAIACISLALLSAITTRVYLPLMQHFGEYSNYVICVTCCFLGALFVCTGMVETKGRTLEEIQDMLTKKKLKTPAL